MPATSAFFLRLRDENDRAVANSGETELADSTAPVREPQLVPATSENRDRGAAAAHEPHAAVEIARIVTGAELAHEGVVAHELERIIDASIIPRAPWLANTPLTASYQELPLPW